MNPPWPPLGDSKRYPAGTSFDSDGVAHEPEEDEERDAREELRDEMGKAVRGDSQ